MQITRKYLKELDNNKEISFISLTSDWFFKSFFKKYPFLLSELINSTFNLNVDIKDEHFIDKEVIKDKEKEMQKHVDILVCPNKYLLIDIECNSSTFNSCKVRNLAYIDKIYGSLFEKGDNYKEIQKYKVIQLNLNTIENDYTKYKNDIILSIGEKTSKVYQKNKKVVLKYLAYYRYLYYTKGVRTKKVVLYTLLTSKGYLEFYDILSNILEKDKLNEVTKGVIEMNGIDFNLHEWKHEMWEKLIRENEKKESFADGRKDGIAIGKKDGIAIGKAEEKEELIKNMYNHKISIEQISSISGKSISEIKEIVSM